MKESRKWNLAGALLAQHGQRATVKAEAIALVAKEMGHPGDVSFWTDIVGKIEMLFASGQVRH